MLRRKRLAVGATAVLLLISVSRLSSGSVAASPSVDFSAGSGAAEPHYLPIPAAPPIRPNQHHYTLQLVQGWASSNDNWLRTLFANKSSVVVYLETTTTLAGGDVIKTAETITLPERSRNTDIPWATQRTLLDRVPADATSRLNLRVQIDRENRLTKIFAATEGAKPLLGDMFTTGWGAYAKLVGDLIGSLFGPAGSSSAFYWSGDVAAADPAHPDSIQPQYIVLLTPGSTATPVPNWSKFTVDATGMVLLYDGQPASEALKNRSFALLRLFKDRDFDIPQETQNSKAAWATLAERFLNFRLSQADSAKLAALQGDVLDALQTEARLLKEEPRFSKLDRARALYSWASLSITALQTRCGALGLTGSRCPVSDIETYRSGVGTIFGLHAEEARSLPSAASRDVELFRSRLRIN